MLGRAPSAAPTAGDVGLRPHESVVLLTGWVVRLAETIGIRALVIKGPAMAQQGLRPERESADVDLWVDPARLDDLVAALEAYGWHLRYESVRHWIVPEHSRTLRQDRWACELDVHDRFPGFFADRHDVFEALWARRTTAEVGGVEVPVSDRVGNAAILALHALRDLRPGRVADDLAFLAEVVARDFTPAEQTALRDLVARCGANDTLAPFLETTGLEPVPGVEVSPADLEDWRILTVGHHAPSLAWVHLLRRTPWWAWPAVAWRAFWLNPIELAVSEPRVRDGMSLTRARVRRLQRGLLLLPRAVRIVVLHRNA